MADSHGITAARQTLSAEESLQRQMEMQPPPVSKAVAEVKQLATHLAQLRKVDGANPKAGRGRFASLRSDIVYLIRASESALRIVTNLHPDLAPSFMDEFADVIGRRDELIAELKSDRPGRRLYEAIEACVRRQRAADPRLRGGATAEARLDALRPFFALSVDGRTLEPLRSNARAFELMCKSPVHALKVCEAIQDLPGVHRDLERSHRRILGIIEAAAGPALQAQKALAFAAESLASLREVEVYEENIEAAVALRENLYRALKENATVACQLLREDWTLVDTFVYEVSLSRSDSLIGMMLEDPATVEVLFAVDAAGRKASVELLAADGW